jgi:GAF domain-containing protein
VPFDSQLSASLDRLDRRISAGAMRSTGFENVLDEYLREVEAAADQEILTSILLLDPEGRRLVHGAAPSLPKAYCKAIDGIEIGPSVGSCGTAAFLGHSIYVTDIAADPLWKDFSALALSHGLKACWSTPIHDDDGKVLGTFAIYYRTPRAPRPEEIEAIDAINRRVAHAVRVNR